MTPDEPWLSVITVVKDDPEGFARTRASLVAQDVTGVEHVVVDSSTDQTRVPDLLAGSSPPGLTTRVTWTPPSGVYPAMNVGLEDAAGRYVYFANAGDSFFSDDVLATVRHVVAEQSPVWMFGEVAILDTHGSTVITSRWDYAEEQALCFSRGRFPAHQATFVKRTTLADMGGFDTSYRIVADYAVFLRLSRHWTPTYLDLVVATFGEGGLSTRRWRESLHEFHRARREVLRPTGVVAVRERLETLRQMIAMGVYRGVIRRPRN